MATRHWRERHGLRDNSAMSLTRHDLESDAMRVALEQSQLPLLSKDAFDASLEAILTTRTPNEDAWVFAYGSLIWNPLIHTTERVPAVLHGYHRRYCLWSRAGRGTPEQPGLMLGLDYGGSCRGVALRVAAEVADYELKLLWRREMIMGSYAPRWVKVRTGKKTVRAIAFVVNHEHPHYAGKLREETVVKTIACACGRLGPCADYLQNTVAGLAAHGIYDRALSHLDKLVTAVCNKKKS
jgi:glutathione-specific gamma-glutamylcyclotransferase